MAPNLLSPFIAQPQIRQSTIKMDLKQAVVVVFDGDLDPRYVEPYSTPISIIWTWKNLYYPNIYVYGDSEELVAMHDTSLSRGNLAFLEWDNWIRNDVNITIDPWSSIILSFNSSNNWSLVIVNLAYTLIIFCLRSWMHIVGCCSLKMYQR